MLLRSLRLIHTAVQEFATSPALESLSPSLGLHRLLAPCSCTIPEYRPFHLDYIATLRSNYSATRDRQQHNRRNGRNSSSTAISRRTVSVSGRNTARKETEAVRTPD